MCASIRISVDVGSIPVPSLANDSHYRLSNEKK